MEKKTECKKEIKILLTNRKGQDIIKFHREETSGGRNKKSIKKGLDEIKQTCYYIRVASDETNKENLDNQTAMQP